MKISRKLVIFSVIALMFLGLFLRYQNRGAKRDWCDFRVYYKTGERFAAKENIYARPDETVTPYKYSPFFAMLMAPFSFLPKSVAALIFFTLNFVSLIAIFVLSYRLIVRDKISFGQSIFLYVFSAIAGFRFALHALDSGQVGIILFALTLFGLHLLHKKKDMFCAVYLSLAIMIKYTPAILLPYLFFKKKVKPVLFVLIFILILSFIPALCVGGPKAYEYIKGWLPFISATSFDASSMYDYKNQSIFSAVLRHFTDASPYNVSLAHFTFAQGIWISVFLGFLAFLFIVFPGKRSDFVLSLDYSLLFTSMALFNPNAWMHNFVVFIFIYMTIFYYLIKINFQDRLTLALAVASFALTTLTSELFVGDSLEKLFERFSCVTAGTGILMFLLFRLRRKEWNKSAFRL